MASLIPAIVWSEEASPRDQVFMLRLLDVYGRKSFEDTLANISENVGHSHGLTMKTLRRLRELGWIEWERVYGDGVNNLQFVTGCKYTITLEPID
jgi:MarR-like DNA-binding transcriptional regulator SgrR of sgrS sRNA